MSAEEVGVGEARTLVEEEAAILVAVAAGEGSAAAVGDRAEEVAEMVVRA